MSTTTPFVDIQGLYRLGFPTNLSMVVAEVAEIMPAAPATGGSRQQIRIRATGSLVVDVHIFDQATTLPMSAIGGVVRISASPNAQRALVWERSKAAKPSSNVGAIVVRRQANIEFFQANQAALAGITAFGVLLATPTPEAPPTLSSAPAAPVTPPPVAPSVSAHGSESAPFSVAKNFGECLQVARQALGATADPEDVRATARLVYEETYGRRTAVA